jgi:hypothetical protein
MQHTFVSDIFTLQVNKSSDVGDKCIISSITGKSDNTGDKLFLTIQVTYYFW